jgi:hypothetical protein
MAHGFLKVIGTTMHLKAKFGDGFRLQVSFGSENENKVEQFMKDNFPTAQFAESKLGVKVFNVPQRSMAVSVIFDTFLHRNVAQSGVEDWGIQQSTLEQVFLKIAEESEKLYGTA